MTRSSILAALAALALAPAAAICSAGDGSAAGDARVAGPAFESGKAPPPTRPQPEPRRRPFEPVRWRDSRSLGKPFAGRLVRGVQLPSAGRHFFTWDPILNRRPNRGWRRWGNDRLVRIVLRVLAEHRAANPGAPRVGVGDLSRPRGGDFGIRYGPPGHASHQNGLDVDLYYPRRDRLERAPRSVAQVDRALAQDLVDRFVEAGAVYVFVGPSVGLTGPPKVVQQLAHHDNHLHVRIPPDR